MTGLPTDISIVAGLVRTAVVAVAVLSPIQGIDSFDTFAAARLTADEVRQIVAGVERSAYDTPESWGQELRATSVDLGSAAGIVLQGTNLLCGGTGNCQIFVFRKTTRGWVSLFGEEQAPVADGFALGPATSHGIKDLTVVSHTSAEATRRETYAFDGNVYRHK